ncbi:MAG: NADH-quinone oxidoreductase subunit NuoE [Hyphomicrobiales bacterium]
MSVRRLADAAVQPAEFNPSRETVAFAKSAVKKFPKGKQASAVIPLLWKVQEQNDQWVSEPAIRWTAETLDMPYIRVYEVATFYTMFNLQPVGKFHVQLCGTTPCMLSGSEDLKKVCRNEIGEQMDVTEDGLFSWVEVECLGACCNAPMVQINKDYYEDLTAESFAGILADLKEGKTVKPGPQNGRHSSEPLGGISTLLDKALYNGAGAAPAKRAAPKKAAAKKAPAKNAPAKKTTSKTAADNRPAGLKKARRGKADDLKLISGVGPKIEGILHSLGIFHFDQISGWKKKERDWVDDHLKFKGRIDREDWVKQAKALAKGGVEEYIRVFGKKPR